MNHQTFDPDQFLYVEKYRPQCIKDCILPEFMKKTFVDFITNGDIPNLIFSGPSGLGKTTVAKAIANELDMDYLFINASEESGIDVLRTKIKSFASSVSLSGKPKLVIFDESDNMSPNSTQPALRGFIEEFSSNCRFIFTCNFKNKIIDAIHSRCVLIDFKITKQDKVKILEELYKRIIFILDTEKIQYKKMVLVELIKKFFPDFRRIINEIQRYSTAGTIDEGILVSLSEKTINDLVEMLKNKKFGDARKWITDNLDHDTNHIFRLLYDGFYSTMKDSSIPQAILILAEYQYKAAFVADHEINMMACFAEIMVQCEWK